MRTDMIGLKLCFLTPILFFVIIVNYIIDYADIFKNDDFTELKYSIKVENQNWSRSFVINRKYLELASPKIFQQSLDSFINPVKDPQRLLFISNSKKIFGLHNDALPIKIGEISSEPSVLLWGDSKAGALISAISENGKKFGFSAVVISRGWTVGPLLGIRVVNSSFKNRADESKLNQAVIEYIASHPKIKTIVLARNWSGKQNMIDADDIYIDKSYNELVRIGLLRAVNALTNLNRNIILVTDVPELKVAPSIILNEARLLNQKSSFNKIPPNLDEYNTINHDILALFQELSVRKNIIIVHLQSILFSENFVKIMDGEKILFLDNSHLSNDGSIFVAPLFNDAFQIFLYP